MSVDVTKTLNLDGPFEDLPGEGGDVSQDWPVYGEAEVNEAFIKAAAFPADVYLKSGDKSSGLVGVVMPATENNPAHYRAVVPTPAPHASEYWDDTLAKFVPSVVVWNGVTAGGAQVGVDGINRRIYDGTLMGAWPLFPPKREAMRDPAKARDAAAAAALEAMA